MNDITYPNDFDNTPVVGPVVEAFINLLAEIASRMANQCLFSFVYRAICPSLDFNFCIRSCAIGVKI